MDSVLHDVRYGLRALAAKPGFSVIAVLTIALGIGANTAMFTVVNAVLLRALPYPNPDQLVRITADLRGTNIPDIGVSVPELIDYREKLEAIDQIAGVWAINANITGTDQPERVEALLASANYFTILGAQPQLGRVFGPEDEIPGITEIAVISDALWRRSFGGDPGVLGQKIRLDNDSYTIIGVMPAGFRHPGRTIAAEVDFWAPAGFRALPFGPPERASHILQGAIARLKPGVTVEQAANQLDVLGSALRSEYLNDYPAQANWSPSLIGLQEHLVGKVKPALLLLLAAVGLVLLIACVNIANLLLARWSARQREIAIRLALGASRWRVVRQMLTESMLVSLVGGALALLTSAWATDALKALTPSTIALGGVRLDGRVFAFAFFISVVTGIAFGVAPALLSSNPSMQLALKEGSRGGGSGARHNRLRSLLVVSEFALALVLMIGAGLLMRSFSHLLNVDPGFDPKNLLVARVWLPQPNDPDTGPYALHTKRVAFINEVLRRLRDLPGVVVASAATNVPLSGQRTSVGFTIEDRVSESAEIYSAYTASVTPDYFSAMGVQVIRGRNLTEQDDDKSPVSVVISETMSRMFWPADEPLGKRLKFGGPQSKAPWMTVVGIVGDVKTDGLDLENRPAFYRSFHQASSLSLALVARTSVDPSSLSKALQREVQSVDPELPVFSIKPMEEVMASAMAQRRFSMMLFGVFAALALLLAGVGIYGVMAYTVAQRTHEIGIRIALGARTVDVLKMVVGQASRLALIGVAAGLTLAFALTRLMSSLLFGVSATDPFTFAALSVLLTGVALLASYIPARRATRVDPMIALRYE
ncbi:MAG: ABC transporter permease [Blastocatellia bacterium]